MNEDLFPLLEETFRSQGCQAGVELLIRNLREQKNYPLIFQARQMQKRHELGLPLIPSGGIPDVPKEHQAAYEEALVNAARETGELFLAGGEIVRAWPYFRAIGDSAPVAAAIEELQPGDGVEQVIPIALNEGVNPRKGFELLIALNGVCRGIDFAIQYADRAQRPAFLQVLVRTIHRDLAANLREAIAGREGQAPETNQIPALIAGRDWLFEGARFYIENSHLLSIIQASIELENRDALELALELTEYGRRLDPLHHFEGQPPFEDVYVDYAFYLRALLGENVDLSVKHFQEKLLASVPGAAEALVSLLTRLGRYGEALDVSVEHLGGNVANGCPSALELCQMAGDYRRLHQLAREKGDLLGFAAGVIQLARRK